MSKMFSIIVAATSSSRGIGKNGDLPWKIAEDMKFFKDVTSKISSTSKRNAVIMGRKTWESIPPKFRPLNGRLNVVLTRNKESVREALALPDCVLTAGSLAEAMDILNGPEHSNGIDEIFIIGGGTVYDEAVASPLCKRIYLTEVDMDVEGLDTFFPLISASKFALVSRSQRLTDPKNASIQYRFTTYDAIDSENPIPHISGTLSSNSNPEEQQYLDIVRDIIENGVARGDRTGTGTLSKFGVQMRFDLRNNVFPLLTTKKVFWRGVAEELIWFVKGRTNAKELSDKDIHIWDGNGSREFLDSRGLSDREEGDLGPVYGFQWRHFGAEYETMHTDYTGKGVDQLADCVDKIKNNPEDRRIIMTAWNPADLDKMALPPCHMFCQFYVANGELSCQMYQRSADMGLGIPFNIASYSLLTVMMAQVCGLKAGDFVHSIGDAHVYSNHVEALKVQLGRTPKPFPKLFLNPEKKDMDSFEFSDFTIDGYNPDGNIKMKMAV